MKQKSTQHTKEQRCPECGGKMHDHTELYINECDRCLAKKAE